MQWDATIGRRLRLADLQMLHAAVQAGSMAKAAKQLSISQPAISRAISEMEHLLGVRLLDRGPRGVEPTRYGAVLVHRATAVFNEISQGVKEIASLADPTVGELRIGSTDPLAAAIVAPIVNKISRQRSRISFFLSTGDLTTLLQDVTTRNVEFAMSRWNDEIDLDGMTTEVLFHDPYIVVAGVENPLARRRKIQLADLLHEPWVMPPYDTFQGRQNAAAFRASGVEPPQATVATLSLNLRNTLLATGRFLTILPRFTLALPGGSKMLRALPVDLPKTRRPIGIIHLKDRSPSPLATQFLQEVRGLTKPLASLQ
jgi:DNA-binding transcriptional LysR family regulator